MIRVTVLEDSLYLPRGLWWARVETLAVEAQEAEVIRATMLEGIFAAWTVVALSMRRRMMVYVCRVDCGGMVAKGWLLKFKSPSNQRGH